MLQEGRATLTLQELLVRDVRWHGLGVVSLLDNESWGGAVSKGRSSHFKVNQLLRRRAAMCAATGVVVEMPWVDTKRQPADQLSRRRWVTEGA